MLARLSIRDIVLIDRLDIDFGIRSCRADRRDRRRQIDPARRLRAGARRPRRRGAGARRRRAGPGDCRLRSCQEASGAARAGRERSRRREDELIVRRVQFADGRTRAFINDQPVSVQVLRALGAALVEIHGQHDDRAFVDAATHRALLDAYGGIEDDAAEVTRLWTERRTQGGRRRRPSRRRRARRARGRMAAPRRRGARPAGAATRRGNRARRPPRRHDAGGENRRGFARDARQPLPDRNRRCRRLRPRCAGWNAARRRRRR